MAAAWASVRLPGSEGGIVVWMREIRADTGWPSHVAPNPPSVSAGPEPPLRSLRWQLLQRLL